MSLMDTLNLLSAVHAAVTISMALKLLKLAQLALFAKSDAVDSAYGKRLE